MKEGEASVLYKYNKANFNQQMDYIDLFQICETALEYGGVVPAHLQACHEITYMLSGEALVVVDEEEEKLHKGAIHVLSKGKRHEIRAVSPNGCRYVCFAFNFNRDLFDDNLLAMYEFYENCGSAIAYDTNDGWVWFNALTREWYMESLHRDAALELLLKYLLIRVSRLFRQSSQDNLISAKSKAQIGPTIYNLLQYIEQHIMEELRVKELAKMCNYSESYLSHIFKEKIGVSLQTYIVNTKIKHALLMLQSNAYNITEISQKLNYESPQAFSKSFKKIMDCTPSEYRVKMQKGEL